MLWKYSEGQETPGETPVKKFKKKKEEDFLLKITFYLNHFIHFQLQNNAPHALKLHLK
jgi:hypothetical protein